MVWDMWCNLFDTPFCTSDSGWPDLVAIPDLSTLRLATWREGTAICICDTVDEQTHEPLPVDTRNHLRAAVERVRGHGYEPMMATEIEFHLCTPDWVPVYRGVHCYSLPKGGEVEPVTGDVRRKLEAFGIVVEACNVEYGPAQVEVNLEYGPALQVADNTMIFKYVVKEIARQHGLRATFMAKPFFGEAGNGLHVHQSLRSLETGKNAFAESDLTDRADPLEPDAPLADRPARAPDRADRDQLPDHQLVQAGRGLLVRPDLRDVGRRQPHRRRPVGRGPWRGRPGSRREAPRPTRTRTSSGGPAPRRPRRARP